MSKQIQEVYINLDDSGKLTTKECYSAYGGIVFLSKKEKDKFITQYRKIVKDVKCSYCKYKKEECNKNCPEIKNTNIKPTDKRRIMNYLKKYYIVALVIKNKEVYENIKINKASRGRFLDYSIRRMIKEIISTLIKTNKINPHKPLKLIINIDEQSTKNNGYYNLREGLIEELKYGITNYNYGVIINPIISSELDISVCYQDSSKSYVIQASDLLAGTIRRTAIDNSNEIKDNLSKYVDFNIILP